MRRESKTMTTSPSETIPLELARRRVYMALFTALAIVMHVGEGLLPAPAPWFRFGFANILAVAVLYTYGAGAAWRLTLTRIGIGALLLGKLFAPGFFLSLGGGVAGLVLMTSGWRLFHRRLGPIGASALGAAGHAVGQFGVAWAILIRHEGLWQLFPLFLLFALLTGVFNGWCAIWLLDYLEQRRRMVT